jgi:hypothetical protein
MRAGEVTGLREIRRRRRWIWFWVVSCVPAVWIVRRPFHALNAGTVTLLLWAIGFVVSIALGMFSRCPRCGGLFFSTHGSPTIWNLFGRKCMQCGLPLKPERIIYPSLE